MNDETEEIEDEGELLTDLNKMKRFSLELAEMENISSLRLFHQHYNPYEKVLRYNLRHGFVLFANLYKENIPETSFTAATAALSMANGAVQMVDGAFQITKDTLHPMRDKSMGALKIISGATGIAFSYTPWITQLGLAGLTGATALSGPVYALTRLIDLTCAAIDYHYALKETKLSGWLEERYKEINYLNKEINKLPNSPENQQDLNNLIIKKLKIENEITIRMSVAEKSDLDQMKFANNKLNTLHQEYSQKVSKIKLNPEERDFCQQENKRIQDKLDQQVEAQGKNLAVKALAFAGALLLAIAPFTGPAAPALFGIGLAISIGVGLYSGGKAFKDNKERIQTLAAEVGTKLTKAVNNMKSKISDLNLEMMPRKT